MHSRVSGDGGRHDLLKNEYVLLVQARQYDEIALGKLYDHYAPRIYTYIYRRVEDSHLAEDLVCDVFIRMINAIREDQTWHTSFQAWLYRVAHNLVIDYYRKQPSEPMISLEEAWLSADDQNLDNKIQASMDRERLRWAIGQLTAEQQQVLALRFGQGLTARETARVLQKTTGAVEALQRRALFSLRRLLAETDAPQGQPRTALSPNWRYEG